MFYNLEYIQNFSHRCAFFKCDGQKYVVKPYPHLDKNILPIVANEYISYRLMMLLKKKGLPINIANVKLVRKDRNSLNQYICFIDYLGEHIRIPFNKDNPHQFELHYDWTKLTWLYWFDKWIGRLDNAGDTNLILLTHTQTLIPIDFAMSYHWACGVSERMIKKDDFDIVMREEIRRCKTDSSLKAIKSITDKEIFDILNDEKLSDFISKEQIDNYYDGLCFRRDNLL